MANRGVKALLKLTCSPSYKDGNVIYVSCKFVNLTPWRNVIEIEGEVVNGPLEKLHGNSWKLNALKGTILLKGAEGDKGRVGRKEFYFHVPELNVIGMKNGIAIVHIAGRGSYEGYIYGSYVRGEFGDVTDVVIGVPPLRGNKAKMEIGGLKIEKELPRLENLKEVDVMLPYMVLNVRNGCKEIYSWDKIELVTPNNEIEEFKGVKRVCSKSYVYYNGFIEEPLNVLLIYAKDLIKKRVDSVEQKRDYLVVRTSSNTFILTRDGVKSVPGSVTYCSNGHIEVIINESNELELFKSGTRVTKIKLDEKVSSCEVLGGNDEKVYLAIPSGKPRNKYSLVNIGNSFTFIPIITELGDPPWREEWGTSDVSIITDLTARVELEAGIFKLFAFGDYLFAYNLYGNVFLFDGNLRPLWKRESRGVRSLAVGESTFALWSQRPPRLRLFAFKGHGKIKEIKKVSIGIDHVALCYDEVLKAYVAIDDSGRLMYIDETGETLLRGRIEPAWACMSFDPYLVTVNENGVKLWKRLSSVEDLNEVNFLIAPQL